jgi:hypothetical protein
MEKILILGILIVVGIVALTMLNISRFLRKIK